MKKAKSQWKQLTRQILALGLAVVLVSEMTDFSVLAEASQKTTAASEETVTEKIAENSAADNTEVETVSGDTVSAEPKVQTTANSADDEAGIAVQADDGTTSGPIEVTSYGKTETYTTFAEMVTAARANTDVYIKLLGDVTDAENWTIYPNWGYNNLNITLDLNGYEMGNKKDGKWSTYLQFTIDKVPVTLTDKSGSEGKLHARIDVESEANVIVEKGEYDLITIKEGSTGTFNGGACSSIYVGSYDGSGNEGTTCTITNGHHRNITVADATTLTITGEETKIDYLSARINETTANITLTGGEYGFISYEGSYVGHIAEMLKDPYVLISTRTEEIIDISNTTGVGDVRVARVKERIAPTWTAEAGSNEKYGIQVKETWYNSKQSTVDFENHIYNDTTLNITFRANDDSGIKKYCYYIHKVSDKETAAYTPKTDSLLDTYVFNSYFTTVEANSSKEAITVSVPIEGNSSNFVIYAYAVDTVGNRSEYICTDGIVIDSIVPTMSDDDGYNFGYKCTTTPTGVTIPFKVSENVTLIYFYYDENMAEDSSYKYFGDLNKAVVAYTEKQYTSYTTNGNAFLPFVKKQDEKWIPAVNDGDKIAITTDGAVEATLHVKKVPAGKGSITITDLSPYTETAVMIQAIDKAGNLLEGGYVYNSRYNCKYIRFQTNQLKPEITKEPSMTGIYGTYPGYMTITSGEVRYNGEIIDGMWAISGDDANVYKELEVGTDYKCKIGFRPYDEKYETIFTEVVPTVLPKEITITFKNTKLTKTYGNELPAITADDFEISEGKLAFEDTKDTIAASLYYDTEAADATADVGTYEFTVKLKSKNYDITVQYPKDADHGTVEVQQAKGEIKTVSGKYKKYVDIEYEKDKEFNISDWVEANYQDAKLSYEVEDPTRNIITVTSDGNVKIHTTGTTNIIIRLPESKNYTAADNSIEIMVNVTPKKITLAPITKNYLYTQGTNGDYEEIPIMSIISLLPEDYGIKDEIGFYRLLETEDPNNIFEEAPTITSPTGNNADAVIKYKVISNGTPGNTAQIKVLNLSTTNYIVDGGVTINVVLVNRTPTELQGDLTLKNNTLTYGQTLSDIQFGNNTFVDKTTKKTVPGTLAWRTPDATPFAGSYEAEWVFTPTDDKTYMECTGKVYITVNKADPSEITAPILKNYSYRSIALGETEGLLSHFFYVEHEGVVKGIKGEELKGTWSWVDPELVPEIGKHTLKVRFTPESQNYNPIESTVTLNVVKVIPYIYPEPSVANAYTHGDHLSSQKLQNGVAYTSDEMKTVLEGTFTWVEPNTLLTYLGYVNDAQKVYNYVFTPKDQEHYESKAGRVSIVVNQAEYPSNKPGDLNVKNSCKTLKDVKLPDGWVFAVDDSSKLDDELAIDTPVSVKVEYQGEDKGNYKNTNVTITVTRSSCDHAKTERRDVIKATCIAEGNTGYLWCLDCNTKLEEGTVTPKDPTNHTALTSKVIKQPTTSEEGIMEYTCSACGYSATKAIAKIASTSSSSGSSSGSKSNDDPAPTPTPTPVATPVPAVTPVRPTRIPVKPTVKEEPKTPAPFLRGENGKEGWEVITEAVTEAEDGDTVIVDMNGSSVVPGDVFDRIRGKDITIEFDLGNGILWKVNGQSVEKGNVGDIDFTVRAGEDANDTIPVEIINNLTGERMFMNLSLAYEGEFGFEAILSLNVGAANAGLYANLFYYNESTKELEYLCAGEIGQDGDAELTFTHASEYTIVIDEQPMDAEQSQEVTSETGVTDNQEDNNTVSITSDAENTGHTGLLIFCIILIAAALIVIGVIVFVKKNKKEE